MTLRQRLTFAFSLILALFALNLALHLWSNHQRQKGLDRLELAVSRQLLVVSLRQQVDDRALEAQLISTVLSADEGGLSRQEQAAVDQKLDALDRDLAELRRLSSEDLSPALDLLTENLARVEEGWRRIYRGEAVPPGTSDPQRRVHQQLSGLFADERSEVNAATLAFADLSRFMSRVTVSIFLLSTLLAVGVAVSVSRQLSERLRLLRQGAERVGRGDLEQPIPVTTRDELGQLAESFNEMAKKLAVLRRTESLLRQEEKMASLGKVAAGLAHELNNPAAALRRNVRELSTHVGDLEGLVADLARLGVSSSSLAALAEYRHQLAEAEPTPALHDPMQRSERESALEDWLQRRGVAEPWELAPDLVAAGAEPQRLDALLAGVSAEAQPVVLVWWARLLAAGHLLDESALSASRLTDIVGAVGRYSHLGVAPLGKLDLPAGIEDTLTVLRSRLRGVRVETDFAADLPPVEGHAGELNQVWTILIDNALDAMGETGSLGLATRRLDDQHVVVEVRDSGPGIPAASLGTIFDPFFTTKPVGAGTGLGLHIAYRIVEQHDGRIEVESTPGDTRFRVVLPVRGKRQDRPAAGGKDTASAEEARR